MAMIRNVLLFIFFSAALAQNTYRRACDCEYTIDGKCAYTLLLPKGQDTCAKDGSTGGESPDSMTSDVRETLMELQTNVSMLWSASGHQARMLNQIQSMFISQQDLMKSMLENITSMSTNAMNSSMLNFNGMKPSANMTDDVNNVMGGAMASLEEELKRIREMSKQIDAKLDDQSMIVDSLRNDVENLTQTLNSRIESLHQKMKMDYYLCHSKGLLVSGSEVSIPDDQITASSQFNEDHNPERSRINTMANAARNGAWCPAEPNLDEWIQLDLGAPRTIYAVVTRGRPDYPQWVTRYLLQYTEVLADDPSETVWVTYKDLLGDDLVFEGNSDQSTKKINDLWQPIRVRYIRIVPTAAHQDSNKCMRVDLLGCVDSP